MEDWCTLMTLPLSDVQRPMGSKFTNCFIVSMSSRDFGWGSSEEGEQEQEKHDFKGKTNLLRSDISIIVPSLGSLGLVLDTFSDGRADRPSGGQGVGRVVE